MGLARQSSTGVEGSSLLFIWKPPLFLGPHHCVPRRDEMNEGRKNSSNTMPSVLETLPSWSLQTPQSPQPLRYLFSIDSSDHVCATYLPYTDHNFKHLHILLEKQEQLRSGGSQKKPYIEVEIPTLLFLLLWPTIWQKPANGGLFYFLFIWIREYSLPW